MRSVDLKRRCVKAFDQIIKAMSSSDHDRSLLAKIERQRSNLESCGRVMPIGHRNIQYFCGRPSCAACMSHWARSLASKLVLSCDDTEPSDFRMATLMLGVCPTAEEAFAVFREARRHLAHVLYRCRNHKTSLHKKEWQAIGYAGALEIDYVGEGDFLALGDKKRDQYRALGYDPKVGGSFWVPHVHAAVHMGGLGEDDISEFFQKAGALVHLQNLEESQSASEAVVAVCKYASKVSFSTNLADGQTKDWPNEALEEYLTACATSSHGRLGFRLLVKPKTT
jgi:hypothetical protein